MILRHIWKSCTVVLWTRLIRMNGVPEPSYRASSICKLFDEAAFSFVQYGSRFFFVAMPVWKDLSTTLALKNIYYHFGNSKQFLPRADLLTSISSVCKQHSARV